MNDLRNRVRPGWQDVLRSVLDRARSVGPGAVLAFDLDSTVFDNRPRQARIVREFGQARNAAALTACQPHHFASGWDLRAALLALGLDAFQADALYPDLRQFWQTRFFTSEYCVDDVAVPGAPGFLEAAARTGALVAYVTGRHEEMRHGTVEAMRRSGMALPGDRVHLIMKPTQEAPDDDFKREAHARLRALGTVVAAFDNEPTHANDYFRTFPEATVIHLATDHSGRKVELLDGVISVPHFQM
jgi:hypothetical protein